MAFPPEMMHERVWFDRPSYDEAENHYQLFLTNNLSAQLAEKHFDKTDGGLVEQVTKVASDAGCALISEIAKARDSIKQSLSGMASQVTHVVTAENDAHITELTNENKELKGLVAKLVGQVAALELRVSKLEEGNTSSAAKKEEKAKDDDDDFDLFGDDDDDEEEETEEEKRIKEERVKKYNDKKSKKPALIAKSSILLDIKPWDDETDLKEMERLVKTIEMDGLVWGAAKLVPLAYGIKKLQILCVIEDDKVSTDDLEDSITAFEDHVQSMDIAAFNKI
eukprot:TCONS_00004917-protein